VRAWEAFKHVFLLKTQRTLHGFIIHDGDFQWGSLSNGVFGDFCVIRKLDRMRSITNQKSRPGAVDDVQRRSASEPPLTGATQEQENSPARVSSQM
jgi:hypothetical protein